MRYSCRAALHHGPIILGKHARSGDGTILRRSASHPGDEHSDQGPSGDLYDLAMEVEWAHGAAEMAAWVDDQLRARLLAGETGFDEVTIRRLLR